MEFQAREKFLRYLILGLIISLAFSIRLISVVRYESVIHEFDPYFNYRSTIKLMEEGFYSFMNWFDEMTWYPIGRVVGGTVFPGIMMTSNLIYSFATKILRLSLNIRDVCVFIGPIFASAAAIITYFFAKEVTKGNVGAGLVSSFMISIVPAYISRSVAGSYDNESVAIFALILTFYLWVKAVNKGSAFYASLSALVYFYMALSWGGYVFIINLIPLHALVLIMAGRYSNRLYITYTTFFVMGTILALQIPSINFQVIKSSEHLASVGVFFFIQGIEIISAIRKVTTPAQFKKLVRFVLAGVGFAVLALLIAGFATGAISPWTGRFYTLLDPTYAKKHSPIIASVAEHQPTSWATFFFDLQVLAFFYPVGVYFAFKYLSDAYIFLILYAVTSTYFVGVMVRLMLVLAPIAAVFGSIAIAELLKIFTDRLAQSSKTSSEKPKKGAKKQDRFRIPSKIAYVATLMFLFSLLVFVKHSVWITNSAYSSPSVVLSYGSGSNRVMIDDYREAYYWLRMNTKPDAKIMSWWDYGYQITGMANRTVLVDNNTWNSTHIAVVGSTMVKKEEEAIDTIRKHDVDYVLVVFGGLLGYSSDDINKYLWLVRIGGTVDETVKEKDYLASNGAYTITKEGGSALHDSLLYKMCYYRFGEVRVDYYHEPGFDRVRNAQPAKLDIKLENFEEAFTSENWLVRIYRVKKESDRVKKKV